jgi:uncharacterized protein (TIGR02118 family)
VIKVVTCIKRKPGMSVEDFQAYWRERHPEVVVRLPGIRRYIQSHTRRAGYRKGEPIFDGIAEVWFDDGRAMHALRGTPEMAEVETDEARFIDRTSTRVIATDEHVIKDEPVPPGAAKNVEFVTRKSGLAAPDFQRYWKEIHGPLAAKIPMIRRYVQSHTRASAYERGRTPAYDGVAVTWFADTDAMRASAATVQYAVVRADEPNFIASGELPIIITTEHVILP